MLLAMPAQAQSWPFSGYSSGLGGPNRLTLGFGSSITDDGRDIQGFGGREDILIGNSIGLLLMATWLSTTGTSSSSVPSFLYSFGVEHERNDVDAFRQSGGAVFSTYGDSTFTGIFFGFGYETPLGGGYSSSSVAVPTFGAALNVGYGWASVDGFGGSFQDDADGMYGRADAYMSIPLAGGVILSPGLSYRAFDFGSIRDSGLSAFVRLTLPL